MLFHLFLSLSVLHNTAVDKTDIMGVLVTLENLTVRQFLMSSRQVSISETEASLYSDIHELRAFTSVTRGSWLQDK